MSIKFKDYLQERLKDEEFRAEYEAVCLEEDLGQAVTEARKSTGLTQDELSERAKITPDEIRDLENGNLLPSLRMLQDIARALNMKVHIELQPA